MSNDQHRVTDQLATKSARRERLRAPTFVIAGLGLATLALRLRDPHQEGSWGVCPLSFLTGFDCPGCGGLRAVNDLTHGRILDALSSNLLVTLATPIAVMGLALWWRRAYRGPKREKVTHGGLVAHPAPRRGTERIKLLGWVLLGLGLAAFAIFRNLPAGEWLAP